MASLGRHDRSTNIWPGFVDALATLLMVIIFLLLIFVLAQFFLGQALSGRDSALQRLENQVVELADLLSLEKRANVNLTKNLTQLSEQLQTSVSDGDDLRAIVSTLHSAAEGNQIKIDQMSDQILSDREKLSQKKLEIVALSQNINALRALKTELEAEVSKLATHTANLNKMVQKEREARTKAENQISLNEKKLVEQTEISKSARAQIALLNQQMVALRQQLAQIEKALEFSEKLNDEQKVQIFNLGKRLNAALATKVQELSRYRSEFFGRLREVLGRQRGIQVVGDRFVFQSEVLFDKGSAALGRVGQKQLITIAKTLKNIAKKIPDDIDWVLRVDGHTDNDPIKTLRFPSNWELSSARAIAVVQTLIANGISPKRLVAAGFGQYQPIEHRADEIAKRRNRRIELKLTQR